MKSSFALKASGLLLLCGGLVGGAFAASIPQQTTVCAQIEHDYSSKIQSLSLTLYANDEIVDTAHGNCISFDASLWSKASGKNYIAVTAIDDAGQPNLLEMRDKAIFDDIDAMSKITLYYDIFLIHGQTDFLIGSVEHEVDTDRNGTDRSTKKYSRYRSDKNIIDPIDVLYTIGATKYDDVNAFAPTSNITREQAAKFFVQTALKVGKAFPSTGNDYSFTDAGQIDPSLSSYVQMARKMGIMGQGNGTSFYPKRDLTFAEATVILMRMRYGMLDETTTPWYKNYLDKAYDISLFDSFAYNPHPTIDGNDSIERGMMAFMIQQLLIVQKVIDVQTTY